MAIKYVDLSLTTSANSGTTGDPYSYYDLANEIVTSSCSNGDIYKIKGSIDLADVGSYYIQLTPAISATITFEGWETSANGPWRLCGPTNTLAHWGAVNDDFNIHVKDGIIQNIGYAFSIDGELKNVYYFAEESDEAGTMGIFKGYSHSELSASLTCYGCSFTEKLGQSFLIQQNGLTSGGTIIFKDSTFNISASSMFSDVDSTYDFTMEDCVTKTSAIDYTFYSANSVTTAGENQYDWSPTNEFPTYNELKSNFRFTKLMSEVTIRGSNDWSSDYEYGLWGNSRYGVGAFYFDPCFSASETTACIPRIITFKVTRPTNDFNVPRYSWDFGDGVISAGIGSDYSTIEHTYTSANTYSVFVSASENSAVTADSYTYFDDDFEDGTMDTDVWSDEIQTSASIVTGGGDTSTYGDYHMLSDTTIGENTLCLQSEYSACGDFDLIYMVRFEDSLGSSEDRSIHLYSGDNDDGTSAGFDIEWSADLSAGPEDEAGIKWETSGASYQEVSAVPFSADGGFWVRIRRIDNVVSAGFSYDNSNWNWFSNTMHYTKCLVIGTDNWDNGVGMGSMYIEADSGLPYNFPAVSAAQTWNCSQDVIMLECTGHIGAFYFGPLDYTPELSAAFLTLSAHDPLITISESGSATGIPPQSLLLTLVPHTPTVYKVDGYKVWFVGVPRKGVTPLCVDFTAYVEFHASYRNKYKITEYKWWFDWDNYNSPSDGVISTCSDGSPSNKIYHIYEGYHGQSYTVKLCVKIQPK